MVNSGCRGYLYQKNDSYILFDKESMCFYTVPVEIGTQIEALDNEEKDSDFKMNKFVIQYLSDYSKMPVEEITMDTRLDLDLNLNSLDFVIMICDIESKYNIHIEDEKFQIVLYY